MTAAENEPELRVSNAAFQRVSDWLAGELRDNARHGLVAAGLLTVGAIASNLILYFLLLGLALWIFGRYAGAWSLIGPALLLAAMYPACFKWGRDHYRRVHLNSGEVRIPVQFSKPLALVETSDNQDAATWSDWLFFPAWLTGKAVHQFLAPTRAAKADTNAMARILVHLIEQGRRVSLHDLESELRLSNAAAALNALAEIDGVLYFHADYPAVTLNDDLRRRVMSFL